MSSGFKFPLSPAAINQDGTVTTSMFVQEPTRLSNYIADVVEANLLAPHIFTSTAASGGALMYDRLERNAATAEQKPGVIAPGGEFPEFSVTEGTPTIDPVVKTGGYYDPTREAEKRNNPVLLQRGAARVANTMTKDIDERAFAVVKSVLESMEGALKFESTGWAKAGKVAASAKTALTGENQLVRDLQEAMLKIKQTEMGYVPNTLLLNEMDALNLQTILGVQNWKSLLDTIGLTMLEVGNSALPQGEGLILQAGAIGVMGVEDPISTDNEYIKGRQLTRFYTWASMAFGVTDPLAAVQLSGLAQ